MPELRTPYVSPCPTTRRNWACLDRLTWSHLHAVDARAAAALPRLLQRAARPRGLPGRRARAARLVGYVRLGFPTPLDCNAHVRQIQGLAVAEEARGRGVGRALVRAAVDEARRRGARRLTLRVLGHNTPARKLYEAEGFVVEGILPEEFLLDGAYVDDVFMGAL